MSDNKFVLILGKNDKFGKEALTQDGDSYYKNSFCREITISGLNGYMQRISYNTENMSMVFGVHNPFCNYELTAELVNMFRYIYCKLSGRTTFKLTSIIKDLKQISPNFYNSTGVYMVVASNLNYPALPVNQGTYYSLMLYLMREKQVINAINKNSFNVIEALEHPSASKELFAKLNDAIIKAILGTQEQFANLSRTERVNMAYYYYRMTRGANYDTDSDGVNGCADEGANRMMKDVFEKSYILSDFFTAYKPYIDSGCLEQYKLNLKDIIKNTQLLLGKMEK